MGVQGAAWNEMHARAAAIALLWVVVAALSNKASDEAVKGSLSSPHPPLPDPPTVGTGSGLGNTTTGNATGHINVRHQVNQTVSDVRKQIESLQSKIITAVEESPGILPVLLAPMATYAGVSSIPMAYQAGAPAVVD